MGPSGAGKSTLLDALSGFKTTGVDGSILINGRRRDLGKFKKWTFYKKIIFNFKLLQPPLDECHVTLHKMIAYNLC